VGIPDEGLGSESLINFDGSGGRSVKVMPHDDRDSPPLVPLPVPARNDRRDSLTLRRYYDRGTSEIESLAEARGKYRQLGLNPPDPEVELGYGDNE
jgi:hypothetical protein